MKQTFGLSWDHGKQKVAAAVALLLIAITMAVGTAGSVEAARPAPTEISVGVAPASYSIMGSTWS